MRERGVAIDHATIHRWVLKYSPQLEAAFHRRKRPVGPSWRMDETYIKVKGQWHYLYRAVDKCGQWIGIALMHMLRKGQWADGTKSGLTAAEQFCALAA
jgi:putative transposase